MLTTLFHRTQHDKFLISFIEHQVNMEVKVAILAMIHSILFMKGEAKVFLKKFLIGDYCLSSSSTSTISFSFCFRIFIASDNKSTHQKIDKY